MTILAWVIIISALTGVLATSVGGTVGAFVKKDSQKVFSLLLCFASGVMLSIICFDLIPEAVEAGEAISVNHANVFLVVGMVLVGYAVVAALNHFVDGWSDKHTKVQIDSEELKNNREMVLAGIVMAIAVAIHNLPEGIVIGASFANNTQGLSHDGVIISIIIALHNIPAGMAIALPMVNGGASRWKAILTPTLSGLPTVVGAIVGFMVGTISPIWLCLALSFASGSMLFVVFGELLPEGMEMWKSKIPATAMMFGLLIGMLLIFFG